ncbi:MAG TPA: serine hydrolase domain-containing protein [Anaerolineales bacterium]|nr:serine hydrolase domain-containing protein [Anaerolineales bacterium]
MTRVILGRLFRISIILLVITIITGLIVFIPPLLKIPSCGRQIDHPYGLAALPASWLARQLMVAFDSPGMAVAVAMDGRIVWSEGLGFADLSRQIPACPQTLFRIGSVSKPLTAVAIARLYEQGQLDLDAPVQDYVPTFPDVGFTITPRQLAGHISGLRHYTGMNEILNQQHFNSLSEGLILFKDDPLLFPPGSHFSYSSYGYNLLGVVIEGASGDEYLAYMKDHVFAPLGMQNTRADQSEDNLSTRATFYEDLPDGLQVAPQVDSSYKYPSGGLLSSAEDLVRFAIGLGSGRLLKPETVELLLTPICPECAPYLREREGEYAMGWQVGRDFFGNRVAFHTGAAVGSSAAILMMPDEQAALALAMNVGSVTNPDPRLHSLPPDPHWIIGLFLLQRFLNSHLILVVSGLALAIGGFYSFYFIRGRKRSEA